MASTALINTFATLAMAESQVVVLANHIDFIQKPEAKDVILSAKNAVLSAYGFWRGVLDGKAMKRLNAMLDRFQAYVGAELEVTESTSLVIAMLDTLRGKISDSRRGAALDRLLTAYRAVHELFDASGSDFGAYDRAAELQTEWDNILRGENAQN
jgi:hypothetical protein